MGLIPTGKVLNVRGNQGKVVATKKKSGSDTGEENKKPWSARTSGGLKKKN
ncbi:hypothetical protein HZA99_01265 [Candidatus Woesearchaeota archaeon]|nr:hypothetical protein [Candidatus Woesearchaeota archaeon]